MSILLLFSSHCFYYYHCCYCHLALLFSSLSLCQTTFAKLWDKLWDQWIRGYNLDGWEVRVPKTYGGSATNLQNKKWRWISTEFHRPLVKLPPIYFAPPGVQRQWDHGGLTTTNNNDKPLTCWGWFQMFTKACWLFDFLFPIYCR
jgi:hypothetical protein